MTVHTFTVTIESDREAEWLLFDLVDAVDGTFDSRDTKVEHVHSRFPSGMMAYPKQLTDQP